MMESVAAAIDLEQLRRDLVAAEGTEEVHDLRVWWCLASQQFALAAHR
jgi:Co/Zn/Cd efflux system component